MIKVLVVDDQAVVRDGLRVILEAADDLEVVGEAEDGEAAIALTDRRRPDVVLMDVRMPFMDGIEATRRILDGAPPSPKVLILSTFGEDEYVYGALSAGASGFLLKDAERGQILDGVRAVASGDRLLAPAITRRLIEEFVRRRPPAPGTPPELEDLTERELEVTQLVAHGLSNSEIADQLVVSTGTVKTHVAHVLQKTGLRDRIQLVVLAYESGLVEAGRGSDPPASTSI
jgi:DNA-binding NarL/FixJ family response regulator